MLAVATRLHKLIGMSETSAMHPTALATALNTLSRSQSSSITNVSQRDGEPFEIIQRSRSNTTFRGLYNHLVTNLLPNFFQARSCKNPRIQLDHFTINSKIHIPNRPFSFVAPIHSWAFQRMVIYCCRRRIYLELYALHEHHGPWQNERGTWKNNMTKKASGVSSRVRTVTQTQLLNDRSISSAATQPRSPMYTIPVRELNPPFKQRIRRPVPPVVGNFPPSNRRPYTSSHLDFF